MTILFIVVFLTIFISFHCSLFESTLYSTRMGALEAAKSKHKHSGQAKAMILMKRDISTPISAILILNTLANTAGATIAGMYAHKVLGAGFVPVFSIFFTLAILLFSEILPKTLGAIHWRSLWPYVVLPLELMKKSLYPAIVLTRKFSNLLEKGKSPKAIYEEEIIGVVRLGAKEGEISHRESHMVRNIIELEDKIVKEIMTPRTVIFSLDSETSVREALGSASESGFSRIPVFKEEKENIIGYVHVHDLGSANTQQNPENPLKSILRPISFTQGNVDCLTLLTACLKKRNHISIVKDDYDGVAGLVTLEDLLETALGTEIIDETDQTVDMQKLARKRKTEKKEKPQA